MTFRSLAEQRVQVATVNVLDIDIDVGELQGAMHAWAKPFQGALQRIGMRPERDSRDPRSTEQPSWTWRFSASASSSIHSRTA